MSDTEDDVEEASVNEVVDATPVVIAPVEEQPTMSPQVLWAFCVDCAQNIMPYREVALRYGFIDVPQLRDFIGTQNQIRKKIKELRAVWNSDDNVESRVKTLAQHAVLAALPGTSQIMLNTRVPDNTRLEALRDHAKIAGLTNNSWGPAKRAPAAPRVPSSA
jgi:hypothetical protein